MFIVAIIEDSFFIAASDLGKDKLTAAIDAVEAKYANNVRSLTMAHMFGGGGGLRRALLRLPELQVVYNVGLCICLHEMKSVGAHPAEFFVRACHPSLAPTPRPPSASAGQERTRTLRRTRRRRVLIGSPLGRRRCHPCGPRWCTCIKLTLRPSA